MSTTFIVQIEADGKWKAVYRGNDPDKATESYHAASDRVGSQKVRCLKSDGEKDDGTTRWVLVKVPTVSSSVPANNDDDDFNIMRDWFGTPFKAAGTVLFFAFTAYLVIELFSGDKPNSNPPAKTKSTTISKPKPPATKRITKPSLPLLESQLETYLKAGGPIDLNSVEGMRQVSAYMNIVTPQFGGSIFGSVGGEIEALNSTTVESGTINFNGRRLPAGFVQTTARIVNRSAGKRFSVCVRMGGAIDKSFQVIRTIAFFSCDSNTATHSEWIQKNRYVKQRQD
ncbi:MAG: hypothetical protein AB3N28_00985 [Kordiimonas sp.]